MSHPVYTDPILCFSFASHPCTLFFSQAGRIPLERFSLQAPATNACASHPAVQHDAVCWIVLTSRLLPQKLVRLPLVDCFLLLCTTVSSYSGAHTVQAASDRHDAFRCNAPLDGSVGNARPIPFYMCYKYLYVPSLCLNL